jgi:Secretion system C-terminal sorting domain
LRPIQYKPSQTKKELTFSLFPNLTSYMTNIQLSLIPDLDLTFVITDVLGRELYRESRFMNTNRHTINMNSWENGLYLLRIMNSNSVIYHHQIHILK